MLGKDWLSGQSDIVARTENLAKHMGLVLAALVGGVVVAKMVVVLVVGGAVVLVVVVGGARMAVWWRYVLNSGKIQLLADLSTTLYMVLLPVRVVINFDIKHKCKVGIIR